MSVNVVLPRPVDHELLERMLGAGPPRTPMTSAARALRELKAASRERNAALAYARDLHERLRPEFEAIAREKQEKVRHLRPLPDPAKDGE
ncbi:hypothetical protein [Micromonospora sp. NPDC050200]|uniref:hypothetical protein n=1 Tax=Micromonospora sp. NPDC050200 TaxID=3155664 RepID=UPI0033EE9C58